MRRSQLVVVLAVLPLLVGACSSDGEAAPTAPAPEVTASSPAGTPTPTAGGVDYGEDVPAAEPSPTWDDAARTAALEHAVATMTAFARPDLDEQQWWADLAPLLTLGAQEAYFAVDPAEVPPHRVTGDPVVTDDSSAWLARVDVPTDVGTYALLLARTDGASPWRTETITPPAALSQPAGR